jgi:hypothetical protein
MQIGMIGLGRMGANMVRRGIPSSGACQMKPRPSSLTDRPISGYAAGIWNVVPRPVG